MRLPGTIVRFDLLITGIVIVSMLSPGLMAQVVPESNVFDLLRILPSTQALASQGGRRGPAPPNPFVAPQAAWWTDGPLVARLGLTEDQRKRIEATAEQYRQILAQNRADLEREEAGLARMLETEPMEPVSVISTQIERVVQARGELERTNSRMTLEIRQILTRVQWLQLRAETGAPAIAGQRGGRGGARRGGPTPPPVPPTQ